ncbi:RtcB family protein [Conexibacter sp. SYSU D00693]|uniref:RtcB family protein n=1 Tax=Conexibacter sp. SYSU D00693 TaxID=2812560 RepID=UPI00196A394A|nr:RtcB family protein [Conexibacter sp. SYSU D00693]
MAQTPITVRGDVDERAVAQLRRCAEAGGAVAGVLCADGHVGYSQPIGGAVAYPDHISPSGVGYDIGCGNKAVRTELRVDEVRAELPRIMDTIVERVSFGVGRHNDEPVDHPVLDRIAQTDFAPQRKLAGLARKQLGTVGAGNHYVDLFAGDDGLVWVGVHFGSRGFGHRTASGFLALAAGRRFDDRAPDGAMDAPPVLLHVDSELGQAYVGAMELAGAYAYAGRDVVVDRVLDVLGARATYEVHNHHNFAWRERHHGTDVWVVRKGCTPAFPGQEGFVGATMGEPSVVLRGTDDPAGAELLHSTVHGAGRVMSRRQAAGRRVKGGGRIGGLIDFPAVRRDLAGQGVELRGGDADEAPDAYKRLDAVLAAHGPTIEVLHRLTPIGVAMAGPDVRDPYKD